MAFQKGISGCPTGRPPGLPDRRTKLRALLEPHAPALIERAVEAAMAGDIGAMRLCLERVCPPLRADSEPLQLDIDLSGEPVDQGKAVLQAATEGRISIDDATKLLQGISAQMRIIEIAELEKRLTLLEGKT